MSKCVAASQHRVVTVDLPFILFCSTFLRCWRLISRQFLCGPRLTRSFRRDIQRFIISISYQIVRVPFCVVAIFLFSHTLKRILPAAFQMNYNMSLHCNACHIHRHTFHSLSNNNTKRVYCHIA